MAKNYSLTEAVRIIVENEDAAQIMELGKRYPLLVSKITFIAAKAGEELNDLMQFMPENLTANKVNQSIKKALEESDEDTSEGDEDFEDDGDEAEEEVSNKKSDKVVSMKDKKAAAKDKETGDTDYDNWNNAKMYKMLGEMGKRKDCKEKYGDMSHDSMLKYLKKYGPGAKGAVEDEDVEDGAEEQASYDGMKAVDLYKLCKERKIKVEKQKPAKYYVALLKKADEEAAKAEDETEDDEDWDDEDEVEEAPVSKKNDKGTPKAAAKPTGKGKGKPVKEEDDEDWDI